MIITCEQCQTKFRISTGLIKVTGTRVRCSNCQAVFTVFAPPPAPLGQPPQNQGQLAPNYGPPGGPQGGPPGGQPGDGGLDDLGRELDEYYRRQEAPGHFPGQAQTPGPAQMPGPGPAPGQGGLLAAIPPKRAENNPINLILGNGDSFVVPEGNNMRVPAAVPPPLPGPGLDLGLGADPLGYPGPAVPNLAGPGVSPPALAGPGLAGPALAGPALAGPGFGAATNQGPAFGAMGSEPLDGPGQGEFAFPDGDPGPPLRDKPQRFFSKSQKILLLVLSVAAAGMVIVTLFLSLGGGPTDESVAQAGSNQTGSGQAGSGQAGTGQAGDGGATQASGELPQASGEIAPAGGEEDTLKLTLPNDSTSNHYIDNPDAGGTLLVLTGTVSNGYDKPIGFIRLQAKLTDKDGQVLAERKVFAGNILTEEELKSLSIKEILTRLALKGGKEGLNTNVAPGKSIPYMFVFDKLPNDLSGYTIDPVSSEFSETASAL